MFRSYLVFGLQLFVILIVCSADKSRTSKRQQKCLDYINRIYGKAVPDCKSSYATSGIIQEFPYIAILGYRNDDDESIDWQCHGTLVSSRYILTNAHSSRRSVYSKLPIKVRLGATSNNYSEKSNSSDYDIEEIIVHPFFNSSTYYSDVGLIKLSRHVKISETVRPICLPDNDIQSNTLFQVNYEINKSENRPQNRPLIKYEKYVVANKDCNELLVPFINRKFRNGITDELMCSRKCSNTSSDYSCIGESGAPLYIDHPNVPCSHIQLGIASFGVACATNIPDVATKVFGFSDWVESVIWADDEEF